MRLSQWTSRLAASIPGKPGRPLFHPWQWLASRDDYSLPQGFHEA